MKKIVKNIMNCCLFIISVVFCLYSIVKFVGEVNASEVSAQEFESNIHSLDGITIDNFTTKIKRIKQINKKSLNYKEELSELNQSDTYTDADGSIYMYNDKNEIISYSIYQDDYDTETKITEKEAVILADEYFEQLVINKSGYKKQEVFYDCYTNTYNIVYGYRICGIKTSDIVYITIRGNGEMVGYSIPNMGEFDDIYLDKTRISDIKKDGVENFYKRYQDLEIETVEVMDIILIIEENKVNANIMLKGVIGTGNEVQTVIDSIIIPL